MSLYEKTVDGKILGIGDACRQIDAEPYGKPFLMSLDIAFFCHGISFLKSSRMGLFVCGVIREDGYLLTKQVLCQPKQIDTTNKKRTQQMLCPLSQSR